jgi:UDP-N-acetylmuramate--alanine ligase
MESTRTTFTVYHGDESIGEIILHVPGKHNVANALAAVVTCHQLEIPFTTIADGLLSFRGVERRFEIIGESNDIVVVDDYAHHPTEIKATLEMATELFDRRVIVIYQPHLYSRTQQFADQFAEVLAIADHCILTDIYPAREEPIEGVTSEMIKTIAKRRGFGDYDYVGVKENAITRIKEMAQPGDLIITMGAGSITHIKQMIIEALDKK